MKEIHIRSMGSAIARAEIQINNISIQDLIAERRRNGLKVGKVDETLNGIMEKNNEVLNGGEEETAMYCVRRMGRWEKELKKPYGPEFISKKRAESELAKWRTIINMHNNEVRE